MSTDFFNRLKKGMNTENAPQADFEAKPIEEAKEEKPIEEVEPPEIILASASQKPEIIEEPVKKRRPKRKTIKNKKEEKKIEVKQESSLQSEKIDGDIFQKEGQLTIDVFETEKDIIIQSAVAGINPEDLDISIEKDMVSIKGKRERQFEEETENFFYQECFWGRFSREVVLPSEVDKDKAEASMKNGVLTIKIPKIKTTTNKKLNINIE